MFINFQSYDNDDNIWEDSSTLLTQLIKTKCRDKKINIKKVKMVRCTHKGKPAWAQNDAMMEAYIEGMDYGYRINDDTHFITPGWTEAFITTLSSFDPPNVGVVGPNHKGGNSAILTYDFISKLHIEIFGYHYPKIFTDWYAGRLCIIFKT